MTKHNRLEQICPVCGKENLKRLSGHLEQVHKLISLERKPYLATAKYQGITAYSDEASTSKISPISKINLAASDKVTDSNKKIKLSDTNKICKRFKCGLCERTYIDKNCLQHHIRIKHAARKRNSNTERCYKHCKKFQY